MEMGPGKEMRVASWNMLAQRYLNRGRPDHLSSKHALPQHRREQTARILKSFRADIILLQEVDDYQSNRNFAQCTCV